jgi:phosphoribosylformylglycinamidine cyclo-ligase
MVDQYQISGVNTDEADTGLRKLTSRIKNTWPTRTNQVKLDIGYFANVIDIGGKGIAITTDGVGSKTIIADMVGKFDTIGIDCVAMNVNDLICVGATPISMVDYVTFDQIDATTLDEISIGLCKGAALANISISGGETSQLPDIITGFDLAGTAIGSVNLNKILVGENIVESDVVIGIESSGIHSNGLSLARHAFFTLNKYSVKHKFDELYDDLGSELLIPTHIYVEEALEILSNIPTTKAFIHITSDGFLNLTRVMSDVGFVIDSLPTIPAIFSIIQGLGDVEYSEMFSVFNMGIGFCVVVSQSNANETIKIINKHGKRAYKIGYATNNSHKTVRLPKYNLMGKGKHFTTDKE